MAYFRKLPVVVQAVQFTGLEDGGRPEFSEVPPQWLTGAMDRRVVVPRGTEQLGVKTAEGPVLADKGDWIIQGVEGELYPCSPSVFAKTYEPAEDVDVGD